MTLFVLAIGQQSEVNESGGIFGALAGIFLVVIVVAGVVGFLRNVRRSRRDR